MKPGPDEMPTTAMKMFRPTEFMNHTVDDGIRPNVGWTDRNQPKTSPEISAPPEVDKRQRYIADLVDESPDQCADRDRSADEGDVGDIAWAVGNAKRLRCGGGVLGAADQRSRYRRGEFWCSAGSGFRSRWLRERSCAGTHRAPTASAPVQPASCRRPACW